VTFPVAGTDQASVDPRANVAPPGRGMAGLVLDEVAPGNPAHIAVVQQ